MSHRNLLAASECNANILVGTIKLNNVGVFDICSSLNEHLLSSMIVFSGCNPHFTSVHKLTAV
jgi:hypothetical protein